MQERLLIWKLRSIMSSGWSVPHEHSSRHISAKILVVDQPDMLEPNRWKFVHARVASPGRKCIAIEESNCLWSVTVSVRRAPGTRLVAMTLAQIPRPLHAREWTGGSDVRCPDSGQRRDADRRKVHLYATAMSLTA